MVVQAIIQVVFTAAQLVAPLLPPKHSHLVQLLQNELEIVMISV